MFRVLVGVAVLVCLALLAALLWCSGPGPSRADRVDHVRVLDRLEGAAEMDSPWHRIFRNVRSLPAPSIPDWERLDRAGPVRVTPRLDSGPGFVEIRPGPAKGRSLHLRWRVPVTPGHTCRVTLDLGLPLSHPDWVHVMKANLLRASARPTVRFVSETNASPPAGGTPLQCWIRRDALPPEPPPPIEGKDLLALTSRFIQGISGLEKIQAYVEKALEKYVKRGSQMCLLDASLDFTAPPDATCAVLGLDLEGLPGPLPLRWAYAPRAPGQEALDSLSGAYRYARTHGDTAFLKRMVETEREHRLSLVMAPRTVVGVDLTFPDRGELLFGLKTLAPLDERGTPAASRLVIEVEVLGGDPVLLHEEEIPPDAAGRRHWRERRVSCREIAGKAGRLRFRLDSPARDRGMGVALSDPIIHRPGRGQEFPSVLLITVDSLRFDFLGKVVNGKSLTPNLDDFAARSVKVSHAVAAGLNTYVSMPGMMAAHPITGSEAGEYAQRLRVGIPTLASALAGAGRFVHAVNPDPYLNNVMKGFHCRFTVPPPDSPGEVDAERVREALAFLERHRDDPFFLWLHLDDPHIPCLPKPEDAPAWEIPGIPDPGAGDPSGRFEAAIRGFRAGNPRVKAAAIRYFNAAFTAEVRYADAWVGKVLSRLRRLDREKNTIVAIHADHGLQAGGDHIGWRDFHDGTIRVPLLIQYPGVLEGGIVRRGVMSLVDVAPTLLDAAGIRAPIEWWGRSRLAWLRGKGPISKGETGIFHHGWALARHNTQAVIRTLDWWYLADLTASGNTGTLHDCRGGKEGAVNVSSRHPEVARALEARLRRTIEATRHGFQTGSVSRSMKKFLQQAGYLPKKENTR